MSQAVASPILTLETSLELYPGINRFALDFTRGEPAATRLFGDPVILRAKRSEVFSARDDRDALAAALIATNAAWGNDVAALVGPWSRGETVTLIAGQQVGFAGGPLYTLAKLASLIRMREDLAQRGQKATVFFWMATEDHDFDEVSTLALLTRDGLREIRTKERHLDQKVVGPMSLPESLRQQLLSVLGGKEPIWLARGLSFGDSFARLIVSVLGSGSVVLVDSLLPSLRTAGRPLFRMLLENYGEIQSLVQNRSRDLLAVGYEPQITPNPDGEYTLLYQMRDGIRQPIRAAETAQALRDAEAAPESISTGALARPLLQDAVLRPDVFVGGPAEVAYYAQTAALHRRLGIDPPRIALRGHVLVAPAKMLRAAERYELKPEEFLLPVNELIARHEGDAVAQLDQILQSAGESIEEQLQRIRSFVGAQDTTMLRPADHSLRKIRHQLGRLSERGRSAIARRDAERYNAITRLCDTLMPNGKPQDRVVGWIGWWIQYGPHLVDRLVNEVRPGSDRLRIVGL